MKARLALSDETAQVLEELKLARGSFTQLRLALALYHYQSIIIAFILWILVKRLNSRWAQIHSQ